MSLKNLVKNIIYLMKHPLERELLDNLSKSVLLTEEYSLYYPNARDKETLRILNYQQTIDLLLSKPKSFCRFGDGEIDIINGGSIPFQKYDERLAKGLKSILENNNPSLYVGINYNYFGGIEQLNQENKKYYILNAPQYRRFLLDTCNKDVTYIAAAFNQLYIFLNDYDFDSYYQKILTLFKDKDVVIFVGKGILNNYKHDVFSLARSKTIIDCKSRDSFDDYDSILERAESYSKDHLLCFILGPTSKLLVNELANKGYLAYDIGHLAKDYDAYKEKMVKDKESIASFYKPD